MEKKKEKTDEEKKEIEFGMRLRLAQGQNDYMKNLINGRYFLARCNMIAEQLQSEITESIDGRTKTEEYLTAEYALIKLQAINSMRSAHFGKLQIIKDFNLTAEDIAALEEDYYNGKIIREDYDEIYNKKKSKAEFIEE